MFLWLFFFLSSCPRSFWLTLSTLHQKKKNNYVLYIISVLAAALPNIPDPQNSPQYNLAGNARTLLTLLLFANWDHYSYLLNCIWFHIFAQSKKHPQCIIHNISSSGFTWILSPCAECHCYLWQRSPHCLSARPCHLSLSLLLFDLL